MSSLPSLLLLLLMSAGISTSSSSPAGVSPRMRLAKTLSLLSTILGEVGDLLEPPLPQEVLDLLHTHTNDGDSLVATPSNANTDCFNESLCTRYEFELNPENKTLLSLHLWTPDEMKNVSVCCGLSRGEEEQVCDQVPKDDETKPVLDWRVYELSRMLDREYEQLFCTVRMYDSTVGKPDDNQLPFLVARMNTTSAARQRRSGSGGGSSKNCSLVDFYVSFTQIGWYRVVAPKGFNAYHCTGKCSTQINSYPSYHHQVLSTILNSNSSDDDPKWAPCCTPTKLSPLHMIYVAGNNTNTNSSTYSLVHHKINNMITESCGCW